MSSYDCRTSAEFLDYINSIHFPNTSPAAVAEILTYYPADPAAGSPFGTGEAFAYSPQYKRMSAFIGDFLEHGPRRALVQKLSEDQPVYSYSASLLTQDDRLVLIDRFLSNLDEPSGRDRCSAFSS